MGRGQGLPGRHAELAAVLDSARTKQGRLVIIRGARGSGRTALLNAAGRALRQDGVHTVTTGPDLPWLPHIPLALLIDDADTVPAPALLAYRRRGHVIIVTCRTEPNELTSAADTVVTLGPLPDDAVTAILADAGDLDEPVIQGLRTALGPLLHNPATLIATLRHLHHRLIPVAGRLCLPDPHVIALPPTHHLCAEPPRVLTAIAILGELRTDALPVLAAALGEPLTDCGNTVDALVDAQVLVADTHGRLTCVCPALATTLAEEAGSTAAQRLHDALATELLARQIALRGGDNSETADHLAAAGRGDRTAWLITLADRTRTHQPHRATHWYAAALRHLPCDRQEHANVLTFLLQLLVQNGQYDLLSQVLADQADTPSPHPAVRDDLEAAAMLTAFHTGHSVKVAHEPVPGGPLDLYAWWLGEHRTWTPRTRTTNTGHNRPDALLTTAELNLIYYALSVDPAGCEREVPAVRNTDAHEQLQDLIEQGAAGDPATTFELILGPRYRVPEHGPLAIGRKVVQGYAAADWSGALPAARQLELIGPPDSPMHQFSRVYAAAIHSARGDDKAASSWLALVSHDIRFAAARTTVEIILLHHAGDSLGAVNLAWRTYRHVRRAGTLAGVERLVLLALQIALRGGDRPMAAALLEEIEQLYIRAPWRCSRQVLLLGRGLMHGDPAAAAEGATLSTQRRHRPDLLWACRILAQFCAEPGPVISELNAIAKDPGACFLLPAQLSAMMRKYGMPDPRPTAFTSTELRVIDLIRTGHTNRQIAAILHLSVKTIENHLTRLFTRTGCRSRVELAAASIDGRLETR